MQDIVPKSSRTPIVRTANNTANRYFLNKKEDKKPEEEKFARITTIQITRQTITETTGAREVTKSNSKSAAKQTEPEIKQSTKRGLLLFKTLFNAKKKKNLFEGHNRIKLKSLLLKEKAKVCFLKMKKILNRKILNAKSYALRKLIHFNTRQLKQNLKATIDFNERYSSKNTNYLGGLINAYLKNNLKYALTKIAYNRIFTKKIEQLNKRNKIKILNKLVKTRKSFCMDMLRKNFLKFKRLDSVVFTQFVRILQNKFSRRKQFVLQLIKRIINQKKQSENVETEKKIVVNPKEQKLIEQIDRLQAETKEIRKKFQIDLANNNEKKINLTAKLEELKNKNLELEEGMRVFKQEVKSTAGKLSLEQVYENIYYNFLFFLRDAQQQIPKEQVLKNLLVPMSHLEIPVDIIKQQNEALNEVLNHYRKLKFKAPPTLNRSLKLENKPYEFLLKQNSELYSTLSVLIENSKTTKNERQFVDLIKDFSELQQKFVKVRIGLNNT